MPDLSFIAFALIWLLGGFVSGLSGIGGAMVAVPLAAIFVPMHELIPLSCLLNVVMDGCIALLHYKHCRVKALLPMLVGSLPGAFAGLYILQTLSGSMLQAAVGILLLFYVYWNSRQTVTVARGESWLVGGTAGFGAGLLGTAISFDGPPIGAYGLYAGWSPRVFLGTLGVFFVLRGSMTCVLQASAGFYTPMVLEYAMWGAPAVMLGTFLAFPVVTRINVDMFRRVLTCVIGIAGVVCLVRGLWD